MINDMTQSPVGRLDSASLEEFPLPRLEASAVLHPLRTWEAMYRETQVTGVEFEEFWYESALLGVACFFAWTGRPRATVLVVLDDAELHHVECRGIGDRRLSAVEAAPILLEVWRALGRAFGGPTGFIH